MSSDAGGRRVVNICNNCGCRLTGGSHALSQGDHLVEVCRVCYLLGLIQTALVDTRLSADDLARVAAQLEEVYASCRAVDVD